MDYLLVMIAILTMMRTPRDLSYNVGQLLYKLIYVLAWAVAFIFIALCFRSALTPFGIAIPISLAYAYSRPSASLPQPYELVDHLSRDAFPLTPGLGFDELDESLTIESLSYEQTSCESRVSLVNSLELRLNPHPSSDDFSLFPHNPRSDPCPSHYDYY
jgi:hypothetical protein